MVEMKTKEIFIGIDPGKGGFICIYNPIIGEHTFYQMPYHKVETGEFLKNGKPQMKAEFHEGGLIDIVYKIHKDFKGFKIHACIEQVLGRAGWSATNNFNFGYIAGMQKLMMLFLKAEILMVRPQKWQSIIYRGTDKQMIPSSTGKTMIHDTKATSRIVAQKMAPHIDFRKTERSKNIDDNKTDAFLMCEYLIKIKDSK